MIFSTLWVNCKNKFQTFFKIFTKKLHWVEPTWPTCRVSNAQCQIYYAKSKDAKICSAKFYNLDFILQYKFCRLIIFVSSNRKSLFRQIFRHEDVVKSSLLKSSLAHNRQNELNQEAIQNSITVLSLINYCLGILLFTVLKLKLSIWTFPQF